MPRYANKKKCLNCDNLLNLRKRKYCSHKCQHEYLKKIRFKEIEGGLHEKHKRQSLKAYITHRDGYICSICCLEKWNNKDIVLIMDHIDGNSENNNPLNLRLVCPNCDSQLPSFKGRNMGKGRHSRRVRYRDGKSF